jgi:hypothetical protein
MTLKYKDFKGNAIQLEDRDLPRIAAAIGCGEDEVHMLMDVEAAGDGFDDQKRPKMLFEPNIFYRELGPGAKRDRAVKEGLAYPSWKKGYPKDSYPRLLKAMAIDEAAALRSASWGASQILGDNFKLAGYASIYDLVNGFCDDEDDHIEAMIAFVKSTNIDDDLRRLAALKRPTTPDDCRIIAKTYNGSGYEKNGYHTKMAAAHNKWKKIPDTPWTSDSGPIITPPPAGAVMPEGLSIAEIKAVQQLLKDKGYTEVGNVDGDIGKNTLSAVAAFQITEGLPVTGKVDQALWDQLKVAKMRPVSEARANASEADVVENAAPPVASTVKSASLIKNIGIGVSSVMGLGAVFDGGVPDLDKLASSLTKTQMIFDLLGDKLPWIIGAVAAGAAVYYGHKILSRQIEGFRKGTVK